MMFETPFDCPSLLHLTAPGEVPYVVTQPIECQ